jgi:Na+:H+ antiporter, NhaA family
MAPGQIERSRRRVADETDIVPGAAARLQRAVDPDRDHLRGGGAADGAVSVVLYGDYLCPYCRRLRPVLAQLREGLGDRLEYAFRHFPNEQAHPGATFIACAAEAAALQGRFWEMHDALYTQELPLGPEQVVQIAREIGLDMDAFARDVELDETRRRVELDRADGRRNGVTGTPTLYVDRIRYDGAWDFYSMLEVLERPVAVQIQHSARVFASLPASGGLSLILAAGAALICANTPVAPYYRHIVETSFNIGPPGWALSLTVGDWLSEGLLAFFFLLVGLEIRREMTAGALVDRHAALLPMIAAVGGVLAPAAIYLVLNRGPTAHGWSIPTATDVAFAIGILALLGERIPVGLRVFVATLAVVDDIISMLTLAVFYSHGFVGLWLLAGAAATVGLYALNRGRVYAIWPYAAVTVLLWLSLHGAGVHAALAGVLLAAFLPTRPAPAVGPLLAQAATALAALEHVETEAERTGNGPRHIDQEPIWDWASRNLSAASARLLSPADRVERAVAPWSAHLILPLFALSATGISLTVNFSAPGAGPVFAGVVLGLVLGKPLGVLLASLVAVKAGVGTMPAGVTVRHFIGAACLCGVGDTVALLMADQAFPQGLEAPVAKIGILVGSVLAAAISTAILATTTRAREVTPAAPF